MTNKKLGNDFEREFCEILSNNDFWVHNFQQNADGQPADVIAIRQGAAYLIDCKVITGKRFQFSRIEENQRLAMADWDNCGGAGWLALKTNNGIYMMSMDDLFYYETLDRKKSISVVDLMEKHLPLQFWIALR